MDLKTVKRLIQMVEEAQISALSLEIEGAKIDIKKELTHPQYIPSAPSTTAPQPIPQVAATPIIGVVDAMAGLIPIKSQMVGTFYSSPKPDADPYVREGDVIKPGDILCMIEAMKLFNEIESDISGTIQKICVQNSSTVEYGQELFWIKPL